MNFGHYSDAPVVLAVDLVNAYGRRPRQVAGQDGEPLQPVDAFLTEHDLAPAAGPVDPSEVQDLADRLFTVFAATDADEAVRVLNELLAGAGALPQISGHDEHGWHLHYTPDSADVVRRLTATTAMALASVLCDYGKDRLGACGGKDCRDVYVDTSRNCSRRYCSDTCSNRFNVAAHRARARRADAR